MPATAGSKVPPDDIPGPVQLPPAGVNPVIAYAASSIQTVSLAPASVPAFPLITKSKSHPQLG